MPQQGERFLDIHEVADKVGLSPKTIRRRVVKSEFPEPFDFGGWRWLESEIDRWMRMVAFQNRIDPAKLLDEEKLSGTERVKQGQAGTNDPPEDLPSSGGKKGK